MSVLLITAAVTCNDPNTILDDAVERRASYVRACCWWLYNPAIEKIVVCENTNDCLLSEQLSKLKIMAGKEIEHLSFQGDVQKTSTLGKGYGEGEIMRYALMHSATLGSSLDGFYKITGRLIIENFQQLDSRIHRECNYFKLMATRLKHSRQVDTRFYYVQPCFYRKMLLSCYEGVNDKEGRYLEHTYWEVLHKSHDVIGFPLYPQVCGYSATTGLYYQSNWKKIFRQICLRLKLYDL